MNVHELWQMVHWLATGGDSEAGWQVIAIRVSLWVCLFFSVVQLLSMLATRWGEKNPMVKSFVLSLLLHACFGLGWATQASSWRIPPPSDDETPPIPIDVALTEAVESIPAEEAGDVPIFQQPSQPPEQIAQRTEMSASAKTEISPVPDAVKTPVPTPAMTKELVSPEITPEQPKVAEASVERRPATIPDAKVETAEDIQSSARQPAMASRAGLGQQKSDFTKPNELPREGASERRADERQPSAMTIPLPNATESPTVPKVDAVEGSMIQRRTSPAPNPGQDSDAGSSSQPNRDNGGSRDGNAFTRRPLNNPSTAATGSINDSSQPTLREGSDSQRTTMRPGLAPDLNPDPVESPSPQPAEIGLTYGRKGPAAYRNRRIDQRHEIAIKNGGTEETEKSVELSLAWLARVQEKDGRWDASRHGGGRDEKDQQGNPRQGAGREADTGVTGLAVLAFLGAGHTPKEGKYATNVDAALRWLVAQQHSNGSLSGKASLYDSNYCHAMATYALAEAVCMQADLQSSPIYRTTLERALEYCVEQQTEDGGWRYPSDKYRKQGDISMFGWMAMALKSGENAGIPIPEETRMKMVAFLKLRSSGKYGGLSQYYGTDTKPTVTMTAEALFSKQILGLRRADPSSREAADALVAQTPRMREENDYYWYYGTLAMFQYGGEHWDRWNEQMRYAVVQLQRKTGNDAGSWDPNGPWGGIGGRVYTTSMMTLCLESYYRFLPLYRLNNDEEPANRPAGN